MNTSFSFQLPASFGQFVNDWLGVLLLLFAAAALVAGAYAVSQGLVSVKRLRRTLTLMFKRR